MPRAVLTVQNMSRTGLEATYAAAEAAGNSFLNDGFVFIHVKNGATDVIITVLTPRGPDGQAVTERTVTCPASEERMIGPFPPGIFNQMGSLGGIVHVDYDTVVNVTIAVIRMK